MQEPGLGRRVFTVLVGIVLVVMAGAVVVMGKRNHDLKTSITKVQEELGNMRSAGAALKVGETLEALELPTLAGERRRLAYDDAGRDTLLLVFSPECPACKQNFENWKKIEASQDASRRGMVYISTDEPEKTVDYAREHALGEVLIAGKEALAKFKIEEIPTTILVGPGGTVKKVWIGVLTADAVAELGAGS